MSAPFHTAFISGATSGIGEAIARLLASKQINLILTGRNNDKLLALRQELQSSCVNVVVLAADLSSPLERQLVVQLIKDSAPDLVVNNAGFGIYGLFVETPIEKQTEMIDVDVTAVVQVCHAAIETLISRDKKGTIINVSSSAAYHLFPSFALYAACKAFVNSFSQSLDIEARRNGIRVLTSCPGMVSTAFRWRAAGTGETAASSAYAMTPAFAAEEIWRQIVKGRAVHIFDWKYRLATFLTQYLLPKRLTTTILEKNIQKRIKR